MEGTTGIDFRTHRIDRPFATNNIDSSSCQATNSIFETEANSRLLSKVLISSSDRVCPKMQAGTDLVDVKFKINH